MCVIYHNRCRILFLTLQQLLNIVILSFFLFLCFVLSIVTKPFPKQHYSIFFFIFFIIFYLQSFQPITNKKQIKEKKKSATTTVKTVTIRCCVNGQVPSQRFRWERKSKRKKRKRVILAHHSYIALFLFASIL